MATTPVKVWTKLLGTSSKDWANALTIGLDGSIYISGVTEGSLDGQRNSGFRDAFLTKYNVDGTKAWTRLIGTDGTDKANALTTGLDGSIYVCGEMKESNGGNDAFLAKYNPDGSQAWIKLLGSSGFDLANALTTGIDGSIFISGYTTGSLNGETNSGGRDAFLTKFSSDGTRAWTKLLGTSGKDEANALTTGLDGSIYVCGVTEGSLDGQTNKRASDAFLIKFNANGTKAWTKLLGESSQQVGPSFNACAWAITTGLDGSIYVGGNTDYSLDGQAYSANWDAFLTKYNPDGTKAWTRLVGSTNFDRAQSLTTGIDGSIYVGGFTNDGSFADGANGNFAYLGFITKFSPDGTKAWTKLVSTSGQNDARAITTGLDGSIYVGGDTSFNLDGQANSGGSGDAFLVKYQVKEVSIPTFNITSAATSVNEGLTAIFKLTTTNLDSGTSVAYNLSGVSASDVAGGALSGNAVVNSSGIDTILVTLLNDSITEGTETLTVTAGGSSASIQIIDTSKAAAIPTYNSVASVPYGNGKYFYGNSGQVISGTEFIDIVKEGFYAGAHYVTRISDNTWQVKNRLSLQTDTLVNIERIEFSDINLALDTSGYAGQVAGILIAVFGPSYLQNTAYAGIGLAYLDAGTSYPDLCKLAVNAAGLNTITLVSSVYKNLFVRDPDAAGLAYWTAAINSGLSYSNFLSAMLQSNEAQSLIKQTNLYETGLAYKPYVLPTTTVINDTSKGNATPTYSLSRATTSVDEGEVAQVYVSTTNVVAGTSLQFGISGVGITQGDVIEGLSKFVSVDATGKAVININTVADQLTEGPETILVTLGASTTSIIINDTSVTLVGVIDNGGGGDGGGGGGGGGAGGGD